MDYILPAIIFFILLATLFCCIAVILVKFKKWVD